MKTSLLKKRWFLALMAFLMGSSLVALMPESWLFVEPEHDPMHSEEAEVWACPMLCVKLDGPGICPVCGMELELLEDTGDSLILNERERSLIDLQTVEVKRRQLTKEIRAFGVLKLNQSHIERITAWLPGRITRLYADTPFTEIRRGDHLYEIYSPELYSAQIEFLAAQRAGGPVARSARQKLGIFGLLDSQIEALIASGEAAHTLTIHSPSDGTIYKIHAQEGEYIKEGSPLYSIADYQSLWLYFDAYEADLPWLAVGQDVHLSFESQPGKQISGVIDLINRQVDPQTRTVKVRVTLANADGLLSPGMYATLKIQAQIGADSKVMAPSLQGRYSCYMHPEVHEDEAGPCPICGMALELNPKAKSEDSPSPKQLPKILAIPRSAVLDTGERQLAYVMVTPPEFEEIDGQWQETRAAAFEPRVLTLGPRAGDWVAVIDGLRPRERVVTQGAFLIDSQMELLGKASLLHPEPSSATPNASHGGH